MGFPYVLAGRGYNTVALAQAMRDGAPNILVRLVVWPNIHSARDQVQSRDLAQAENCDRFNLFPRGF
jgi:hypothetical protein